MAAKPEKVSPTAYATGYLWYRKGMSHEVLATEQGRKLDRGFRAMLGGIRAATGISLEAMLVARHKGIDGRVARAIEAGRVDQVIDLTVGLSPRGLTFVQRYPQLTYVETDLAVMADLKRRKLADAGLLSARHRVVQVDALAKSGPHSLSAVAHSLDPKVGTAVITEGLLSYLDPPAARTVWRNVAATLKRFPHGSYFADAYLARERSGPAMVAFGLVIMAFVRGRMYRHFRSPEHAQGILAECGFKSAELHRTQDLPETSELAKTPGADRVRVLEASV